MANIGRHFTVNVRVHSEMGLHARPAAQLAREAQRFSSNIRLVSGDMCVDAKSILEILTLAAGRGASLEIQADGHDAREALDSLSIFFQRADF